MGEVSRRDAKAQGEVSRRDAKLFGVGLSWYTEAIGAGFSRPCAPATGNIDPGLGSDRSMKHPPTYVRAGNHPPVMDPEAPMKHLPTSVAFGERPSWIRRHPVSALPGNGSRRDAETQGKHNRDYFVSRSPP